MKVVKFPNKINNKKKTMILGSFNSFHNGHKLLLDVAKSYKNDVILMLIDDLSILKKESKKDFESLDIRLQQIANIGIDEVVVVNMNKKILGTSGPDFAKQLVEAYNVNKFVVGKDFAMGKGAAYSAKDLQKDFDTTIVKTLTVNNKKMATQLLREFVEFGDVHLVKKNSPFYFTIDARIKADKTFNIEGLTPHTGIYAAWAIVNDVKYWSVIRISSTGTHEIKVPDLLVKNSGFNVQIEFAYKIRAIVRKDFDLLIKEDSKKTVEYLKNHL